MLLETPMRSRFSRSLAALLAVAALLAPTSLLHAGPISVDGMIGSEWAGAKTSVVGYDPNALTSNFQNPSNVSNNVAYNILTRSDGTYIYVGLQALGDTKGLNFANLYFSTDLSQGSTVGFQVTIQNAFNPDTGKIVSYQGQNPGIQFAASPPSSPSVIEFAVPISFFTTDPLGLGFPLATSVVQVRLSQSFGYSVAGGPSYGDDRFGTFALAAAAPVPEPASLALFGTAACAALAWMRRRVR